MKISEAESVVMQTLWHRSPCAAHDIAAALGKRRNWQESTVKTLLNRLLNKGAVSVEREGRRYLYRPVLTREDWIRQEGDSWLERLFGGRIAPLVAHFAQSRPLSREEIAELRRLIDALDDGR